MSHIKTGSPRMIQHIGVVDKKTGRVSITREAWQFFNDLWRRTGGDTDAVSAASTTGISLSYLWRSDGAGVFPSGNPSEDLVVVFFNEDAQVATRTVTGTLDSTAGTITGVSSSSSGEATTYELFGDGTDSIRFDITHTNSGAIASATFTAIDNSAAGSTPLDFSSGGGYGGVGGGSK